MPVLSKGHKLDNFESHNSLKFSFINIWGLCSNFVSCESFLESNSPGNSCSIWDKLGWFTWFWQFLSDGLCSYHPKGFCYLHVWSCSEEMTCYGTGFIFRKLCKFLLVFLTGFTSSSVLLLFPLWIISLSLCTVFHAILSNIDEFLSINPSTHVLLWRLQRPS